MQGSEIEPRPPDAGELSSDEYLAAYVKAIWGCEKLQVSEPMSLFDWDGAECP
jgi:hypothetical protein